MTISHSKLFLPLAVLSLPALAEEPPPEIVRIVTQSDDLSAQAEAKAWIERHRHDMAEMGKLLVAAGFKQEEARPRSDCGAYTYAGKRVSTGQDIAASFVICPGKPPAAMVFTLLPVDKNPKGPLPLTTPPIATERG